MRKPASRNPSSKKADDGNTFDPMAAKTIPDKPKPIGGRKTTKASEPATPKAEAKPVQKELPVAPGGAQTLAGESRIFKIHPLAEAYPHMTDAVYQPFKESLLHNGQHNPIVVIPDEKNPEILQVIDGRHRYTALEELGMEVKFEFYKGPVDEEALRKYVESQNVHRRDLSDGQRAMSAAKLYSGAMGRPKKLSPEETDSSDTVAEEIAKRNGISLSYFRKAVRVNAQAKKFPAFVEHVFEGRVTLPSAYDMVSDFEQTDTKLKTLNVTVQDFKKVEEAPSSIGEVLRRSKGAAKKAKRDERDQKIAGLAQELPDAEYQVVYADPPWKFETRSEAGMDRSAENHYPTMSIKEIRETRPSFADKAVLFLWTTNPFLKEAMDLLDVWGLEYKSNLIWAKDKMGTGYWNRQNHEILIIATTEAGFPAPPPEMLLPSCQTLPRGRHSEKPPEFAEFIEKAYPTAKKLEMYCRTPRDGWDHWGNEASGTSLLEQIEERQEQEEEDEDDQLDIEDQIDDANDAGADEDPEYVAESHADEDGPPMGDEDEDGFFDSARSPSDPLNLLDSDEPPGL